MSEQQFYENYWQNATNNYGGMLDSPPQWTTEQINSHLKDFEPFIGEKTLDVGCGEGVFTEALSTITNSTGLEISQEAINRGEKRNSSLKLMQGDLNNIPFEANMFDSLTMIEVIEHLVDVKQSVSECYRVLKPGGHLIITTTDFNWPKKLIIAAFFWDKFFFPYNPHIRFFTKKTLEKILIDNGFDRVYYKWNGSYFGLMPHGQIMIVRKR